MLIPCIVYYEQIHNAVRCARCIICFHHWEILPSGLIPQLQKYVCLHLTEPFICQGCWMISFHLSILNHATPWKNPHFPCICNYRIKLAITKHLDKTQFISCSGQVDEVLGNATVGQIMSTDLQRTFYYRMEAQHRTYRGRNRIS